jgi:hypothetical protein
MKFTRRASKSNQEQHPKTGVDAAELSAENSSFTHKGFGEVAKQADMAVK